MSITIIDLVGSIFNKNPNLGVQFLSHSLKNFKRNKQDSEITFYTEHKNTPTINPVNGEFLGKNAIVIWVDDSDLKNIMSELEKQK